MSAETAEMELELLRRRAEASGHYVNRHKTFDSTMPGGDLYLMEKRTRWNAKRHLPSIIRYATAEHVHAKLTEIEQTVFETSARH
jgi:hypothetical protein